MKKTLLVLFILIFTLSSAIALSSCKTEEEAELKEWAVEFIVDGHVYSNAVAKEGQSLTLPVPPEKAGYDFGGWYIDESFTKEYTESYFVNNSPEDNLRVYAKWTRLDVEISSASMTVDGLSMTLTVPHSSESFDFGADLTVSSFADWILSPDQYGMQSIITKVAPLTEGSNTYYIHVSREGEITTYTVEIYRNHLYRVEFDTLGGEELEPISVEEGQLIPPPAVSRPGYSLVGWDYDLTDPVTSDLTLSAVWAPNDDTLYTV